MEIRPFLPQDYPQIATIYQQGLDTGIATFETTIPTWEEWDNKHCLHPWLAAFDDTQMVGWVALSPVSSRHVYRGVAEVSLYIASHARGKGAGTFLLKHLIHVSESLGFWTLQSSIFAQNTKSIQLHQNCGFRIVGIREKIGQCNGIWHDTVLMEKRSKIIE